jgi:hypothetical protein
MHRFQRHAGISHRRRTAGDIHMIAGGIWSIFELFALLYIAYQFFLYVRWAERLERERDALLDHITKDTEPNDERKLP